MTNLIGKTILHYRIIEQIGQGGMGIVYKAEDTRLKRTVAIKFLPWQLSANKDEQLRFKVEAQAAAALNHPHIATIHAIEETQGSPSQDGELFIVMEYIDGRELREVVQNNRPGELSVPEILNYAIQIAEGLQAAHEKGIVHRDIKSGNIMLTSDGNVKIMDFGLAKMHDSPALTQSGSTVGTTAYMSPEQVRGETTDPRTDIWAFGVVLYEMLTGRYPFTGEYEQAILYSVLHEPPDPFDTENGEIPDFLAKIVLRCLQKQAEDRYQSMSEILVDLHQQSQPKTVPADQTASSPANVQSSPQKARFRHRRFLWPGTALLLVLFLFFVYPGKFTVTRWLGLHSVPDQQHLLVLPFTNIGNDSSRQVFCDGLVETLTSKLSQLEQFHGSLWVVPATEVRRNKVRSPGEAYSTFGVNLAVSGSLQSLNNIFRLTINLIDAKNMRQLNSTVIDVPRKEVVRLQKKTVATVLDMLNLELKPRSRELLTAVGTTDPGANQSYLRGKGYLQRYDDIENLEAAIGLFRHAVRQDSTFALAYAGLGEAFWRKYEFTNDQQYAQEAIEICQKAYRLNPDLAAVNIALGLIHRGTGKYEDAVLDFNRALNAEPTNPEAYRGLARAYESLGRTEEAEQIYQRAIQTKPDYWAGYNSLGVYYYRHGRYREAVSMFKKVTELTPDNYKGFTNLGGIYYMLKDWTNARKMYEKSLALKKTMNAASNLGVLYFIQGHYAKAARTFELALSLNDRDHGQWGNLASAYYWVPGKREKSLQLYRRAIELAEKQRAVNPRDANLLSRLGGYYATIGQKEKAETMIKKSLALAPEDIRVLINTGTSYEILGEREQALKWIGAALEKGYSQSDLELQPEMKNLVADPRYRRILSRLGKNIIEKN